MRSYDPCTAPDLQLWDTTWLRSDATGDITADWNITGDGMQADNVLATCVFTMIFTDRRAPETSSLPSAKDDLRGWYGDAVDVRTESGEAAMGSLLWLYEREALTPTVIQGIEDTVYDCLQPLVDQGLIADRSVDVEVDKLNNRLCAHVQLYAKSGEKVFDSKYQRVWDQFAPEVSGRY